MDRLVCGDVGFGKTESRCAQLSRRRKQVAVVVPTTLLSRQHLKTFRSFPRRGENRASLAHDLPPISSARKLELQRGIDIVIGTRVARQAIKFKDLGLLVVDENSISASA